MFDVGKKTNAYRLQRSNVYSSGRRELAAKVAEPSTPYKATPTKPVAPVVAPKTTVAPARPTAPVQPAEKDWATILAPVKPGIKVHHKTFGDGTVAWMDKSKKYIRINFTIGGKEVENWAAHSRDFSRELAARFFAYFS